MVCLLAFLNLRTYVYAVVAVLMATILIATTAVSLLFVFFLVCLGGLVCLYGLVLCACLDEPFLMLALRVCYSIRRLVFVWLLLGTVNDVYYPAYYAFISRL